MSNSIQFMKDLQKGKQREELFMKWCDNRGLKYLDVRDDEYYRAIDVDFLIHVHDIFSDTYVPIDVKCCSLKKGSIMVEMTSGKYGNSGWFEHGKAEWYVYTAPLQSTDGYLILTLRKTWIEEWIGYYNVKTQRIGDGGAGTQSEVLYTDFWGYDYVNQKPFFYTANTQVANLENNPIKITTPSIANNTHFTLFFADGNKVRVWNYASDLATLPNAKTLLTVGSPFAQITGFEMSEDHKKTYVSFYDSMKQGLNGSVWVFDTDTGEVLERYNNFCYKPVKMFYKTR